MGDMVMNFDGISITINDATDRYNTIRKDFMEMSIKAGLEAKEVFESSFADYSSFCASGRNVFDRLFNKYLQQTVWKLVLNKVYYIDEVILRDMKLQRGLAYGKALNGFFGQIYLVDEERQEKISTTKSVAGGLGLAALGSAGYGISAGADQDGGGMLLGMCGTGLAATAAAGTAAVGFVANAIGKSNDEVKKKGIFESEFNRNMLYEAFEKDVYSLNLIFADIVNEKIGGERYYYYPTEEILAKDEPYVRNIVAGNYLHDPSAPGLEVQIIEKILTENPYNGDVYSYIARCNNGISPELKDMLAYLGMSMDTLANAYLQYKYGEIDYATYEEICEFEKVVRDELVQFGTDKCRYLEQVCAKKEELYIIRRTYNGHLFDTIEIRDAAEKQYNDYLADIDFAAMNLDELLTFYFDTFTADLYEEIKSDIQLLIMNYVEPAYKNIKTLDAIMPYYGMVKGRFAELGITDNELLKLNEKCFKKLNTKAKFASAADSAKEKSKELISKIPFGKNKADTAAANAENTETAVDGNAADMSAVGSVNGATDAAGNAASKAFGFASKGIDGAKGFFKKKDDASANSNVSTPVSAAPAVNAATPVSAASAEYKKCPQCGKEVKINGKFCGRCGYGF